MILNTEEIEKVLKKELSGVSPEDIHRAATAISAAQGQWQEVNVNETIGANYSCQCRDICGIGNAHAQGLRIRAFIEAK